jgi:hypothetical protein
MTNAPEMTDAEHAARIQKLIDVTESRMPVAKLAEWLAVPEEFRKQAFFKLYEAGRIHPEIQAVVDQSMR